MTMMLSRLAPSAKAVRARAYGYAARDDEGEIGEEHLLEALLAESDSRRLLGDGVGEQALGQIRGELAASRRKGGLPAAEEAAMCRLSDRFR